MRTQIIKDRCGATPGVRGVPLATFESLEGCTALENPDEPDGDPPPNVLLLCTSYNGGETTQYEGWPFFYKIQCAMWSSIDECKFLVFG